MTFIEKLDKEFSKHKFLTFAKVEKKLGCCLATLLRYCKSKGYYTSCNKNGKYYILAESCKFDENGLFVIDGVMFSKFKTIKATLLNKINNSDAGYSSSELKKIYGENSGVSLSHLFTGKEITRKMINGVFYYFSSDTETHLIQQELRIKKEDQGTEVKVNKEDLPSSEITIAILTFLAVKTKYSAKQLKKEFKKKGYNISITDIKNILLFYNLESKKK